jgi:hypothetical protein
LNGLNQKRRVIILGAYMKRRLWMGAVVTLLLAASLVSAHHSVLGQFDPDGRVELTGVISRIDWINPHIYVHLDVEDEFGEITAWRLESVPPAYLYKAEVTQEMLMGGGKPVRIEALRARDGSKNLGFIIRIHYPEGHHYQLSEEY